MRVVDIKTFNSPDFYSAEMRGRYLLHTPEDLVTPDTSDPKNVQLDCESDFDFFDIRLGQSGKNVIRILGKPFMKVKNDSNMQEHFILLYKRRYKDTRTTYPLYQVGI